MANTFFDNPPVLMGDEKEQLVQLRRYLSTMSDQLNMALMSISIEQMAPETQQTIRQAETQTAKNYESLKSMIVKTAEVVRHEMDEITTRLEDHYDALSSQFGEYQRDLVSTITATANGILQDYHYEERITGLEGEADDTEVFKRRLDQYIFSGLVDEVNGKYGIAIGEDITSYDAQGNPYINSNRKTATFTMDELAFWHGEIKMAWFTDNVMHIAHGEVTDSMRMGAYLWKVFANGSMGLMKE